jgi:hypothetical protein
MLAAELAISSDGRRQTSLQAAMGAGSRNASFGDIVGETAAPSEIAR